VVLVYVSLLRGPGEGAVLGFLTGLLFDLSSPQTLGAYAFARSVVGFAVGSTSESLERGSLLGSVLVVLAASLLHDVLYLGTVAILARGPFPSMMAAVAVPAALYTALVTPPAFWLLRRFVRLRRARRRPA
jgi:rod shape-determining protein MreD